MGRRSLDLIGMFCSKEEAWGMYYAMKTVFLLHEALFYFLIHGISISKSVSAVQWGYFLHVRNNPTPWPLNFLDSRQ